MRRVPVFEGPAAGKFALGFHHALGTALMSTPLIVTLPVSGFLKTCIRSPVGKHCSHFVRVSLGQVRFHLNGFIDQLVTSSAAVVCLINSASAMIICRSRRRRSTPRRNWPGSSRLHECCCQAWGASTPECLYAARGLALSLWEGAQTHNHPVPHPLSARFGR
jgi:hypothetical protein